MYQELWRAAAPTTGTLIVNKVCVESPGGASCQGSFNVQVLDTNTQLSSFSLTDGGSQDITFSSGPFTLTEVRSSQFIFSSVSGDCMLTSNPDSGVVTATGTIAGGQHLTCTITNGAL